MRHPFNLRIPWLGFASALVGMALAWNALTRPAPGATPTDINNAADFWLTNAPAHATAVAGAPGRRGAVDSLLFTNLHAEALAGRLTISWQPEAAADGPNAPTPTAHVSAADPGQWPIRDWRTLPMKRSGNRRQVDVPTEELDVPIVYYVRLVTSKGEWLSPLRVVYPNRSGLEEPTQLFWPFIEGFEDGHEGWWFLSHASAATKSSSPDASALQTTKDSKNGRAALQIAVPGGDVRFSLATTRIRGWQLLREGATGLRFWVKSRSGHGRLRCSLQARSFTTNQVAVSWPTEPMVTNEWRKIDLTFAQLPLLPWRSVDLFVLEFRAPQATEFLLDDVQWLGPWRLHPE